MGISCKPSDFVESGGKFDDYVAVVKDAKFEMFDYNGKFNAAPTFHLSNVMDDGTETEEYVTLGDAKVYFPSGDGKEINGTKAISPTSNFGILIASLVNAGFPEDNLGDKPGDAIKDGKYHFVRVAPPKNREKMKVKEGEPEKKVSLVLTITELVNLPGEAPAAATPGADAAEAGSVDIGAKTVALLLGFIDGAKGKKVQKTALPTLIFSTMGEDPDRNEVMAKAFDDAFLSAGPWTFKDGVLSPAK